MALSSMVVRSVSEREALSVDRGQSRLFFHADTRAQIPQIASPTPAAMLNA